MLPKPNIIKLCVEGEKLMSYDNSWLLPLLLHGFWEMPVSSVTLSGNAVVFPSLWSTICYLWTCTFTNEYIHICIHVYFYRIFFWFQVENNKSRVSQQNTIPYKHNYSLKNFTMLHTRHCSVISTSNDQLHLSKLQLQRVAKSCWSKYQSVC